jgi:hypothetical protein
LAHNRAQLISVITPVDNGAETLPYACDGVLAQTLTSFKLIIVIRNTANRRQADVEWEQRFDGLATARGSLAAHVDADNTWDRRYLELLATALMERPHIQPALCRSRNYHDVAHLDRVMAGNRRTAVERGVDR